MYLGVVLNPLACKNRATTDDRCARFRHIVGPWGEVHESRSLDDLGEIVAGLLPGASHLVSDGGDGTLHWLINEVRSQDADPERWPAFVPSRAGTIDFVARKARVRGRADSIVSALAGAAKSDQPPPEVPLDTLSIDGRSVDGTSFQRVGFALAAGASAAAFSTGTTKLRILAGPRSSKSSHARWVTWPPPQCVPDARAGQTCSDRHAPRL
jgi:hypothetical protein